MSEHDIVCAGGGPGGYVGHIWEKVGLMHVLEADPEGLWGAYN